MEYVDVYTQQELEAALVAKKFPQLRGNGVFEVRGSSTVTAYGSSTVRACDSSAVRACDSSTVTACDSSTVTACGSSTVTASKYVPVQILSSRVKVGGGVQIRKPSPKTAAAWCSEYQIKPIKGVVILYKAVGDNFHSPQGCDYSPGTIPVAADWDGGEAECGGGLHFSPFPWMAMKFNPDAKRFIACPVRVKDIGKPHKDASYPDKCKAMGCCAPTWECDIDGKPVKQPK